MRSQSMPISISTISVCSEAWGARVGLQRLVVELDRSAHDFERLSAVARLDLDDHVVGDRLFVGHEVDKALERRPLTLSSS